jgi:hypothetical protein
MKTKQLTWLSLWIGLHVIFSSWIQTLPQFSFLSTLILPYFAYKVVEFTRYRGWLIYGVATFSIQVGVFGMPIDWYVLLIFPAILLGGFLRVVQSSESIITFSRITVVQFLMVVLINEASLWLYGLNYQTLFLGLFDLDFSLYPSLLYVLLYALGLFQMMLLWTFIHAMPHAFTIKITGAKTFKTSWELLILIVVYAGTLWLPQTPFLWLIGPLLLLSTHQILTYAFSQRQKTLWILIGALLLYPILHALIATYLVSWALPWSLLAIPLVATVLPLISRSPSHPKIG